jgi:fructoselysine-6-P-deglycase FrlB-like protein
MSRPHQAGDARDATEAAAGRAGLTALRPDGPDTMGREIAEGPAAVGATIEALQESAAIGLVAAARRVVLVGTGASLAVAETAAPAFGGRAAVREASAIALSQGRTVGTDDGGFEPGDVVVVVSQSGESPETRAAARLASAAGTTVVAVTAHAASRLASAADAVVVTPIGEETGAATKSALTAFAALAVLAGSLSTEAREVDELVERLDRTVGDLEPSFEPATALVQVRHAWVLGFGPALGLARATSLLLHEKARRPAVFCTPSEFRHGLIEAATSDDAVVLIDVDVDASTRRRAYLERLSAELAEMGVPLVRIAADADAELPLPRVASAEACLHAFIRAQQLARATAHAAGTYGEEFRVLRRVVHAADDLF